MSADDRLDGDGARDPIASARGPIVALPKRFYTSVTISQSDDGHRVLLDGRPVRTPKRAYLSLPTRPLADAVGAEWEAQATHIDPATMPLTRLANTALDGVTGRETDVRDDIVRFAGSDLLCYRAGHPAGLVERQTQVWDPILAWALTTLNTRFIVQTGIMPVTQPPPTLDRIAAALPSDAFSLAALHVLTTLMGSAVLALAVHERHLEIGAAWAAAHVDEDWQIAEWGEDREAVRRRAGRLAEATSAAHFLALRRAR
jgi:chaperone required for assembly of F1-ATPase